MSRQVTGISAAIVVFLWIVFVGSWCVNVYKLVRCDFAAPYKSEVVHAIGVFVPLAAIVTAWYGGDR